MHKGNGTDIGAAAFMHHRSLLLPCRCETAEGSALPILMRRPVLKDRLLL